jgi:CheY-like chemotaxis protein
VNLYKQKQNKPCGCINRTYKLIFMDIQMPVMDGEEASKQILKLQKEKA